MPRIRHEINVDQKLSHCRVKRRCLTRTFVIRADSDDDFFASRRTRYRLLLNKKISLILGKLQAPSADEKHEIGTRLYILIVDMLSNFLVPYYDKLHQRPVSK